MIEIKAKRLREYFRVSEGTLFSGGDIPWRVRYRHWLHPLFFLCLTIALFFVLSLANSFFLAISLSLVAYMAFVWQQTRRIAEFIEITRSTSKSAIFRRPLKVVLTVKNRSRFPISDLVIKDSFTVSTTGEKTLWLGYEILPRQSVRIEYEIVCDAAMGKQSFGPLQAVVTDPLGLFEFRRVDDQKTEIDIVPSPSPKLAEVTTLSLFSDSLGNQEAPRPGDSVSFFELRNYNTGDSLKRISWKLSARFQKLLVKEFEDLISNDFTMFLDFDKEKHYGLWKLNTWEALKEVGISVLIHKELNRRFQVMSQELFLPFSAGQHHAMLAIKKICRLQPTNGYLGVEFGAKLQTALPYGSSLLYIAPTALAAQNELIDTFRILRQKGIQVSTILIDTSSFTQNAQTPELESFVASATMRSENALKDLLAKLDHIGINCTVLGHEDFIQ